MQSLYQKTFKTSSKIVYNNRNTNYKVGKIRVIYQFYPELPMYVLNCGDLTNDP